MIICLGNVVQKPQPDQNQIFLVQQCVLCSFTFSTFYLLKVKISLFRNDISRTCWQIEDGQESKSA
jgi:hypothetical protein